MTPLAADTTATDLMTDESLNPPAPTSLPAAKKTAPSSGSRSGGQTTPSKYTARLRKPKKEGGIWIVEKSLDKKNWIATNLHGDLMWSPTRAKANEVAAVANQNNFGIHYRVTRYEPVR